MTVLLNNIDHHDLRIMLGHGASFGDAVAQMRVFATEFEEMARDYAIVFRRDADDAFEAIVLLGLEEGENLFLENDRWVARSIPALCQRGPFSIGGDGAAEPVIHVDLAHPRIAAGDRVGEPVFLPHGGNAPYLDHVAAVLRRIHVGHHATAPLFAALEAERLIEPVTMQITLDETLRYDLPGLYAIDGAVLAALDGAALDRLHRAGFLRPIFAVAASMGNIARLIDLKNARRQA